MKKAIFISGVIGSGKTTLARQLAERYDITLREENIKNDSLIPEIKKFYHSFDPETVLRVQRHFIRDSEGMLDNLPENGSSVFDTFPFKSQRAYVTALFNSFFIDKEQYDELNFLLDSVESLEHITSLHIHCDTPSNLFNRIYSRGSFEKNSYDKGEPSEKFTRLIAGLDNFYLNSLVTNETVFSLDEKLHDKINKFLYDD